MKRAQVRRSGPQPTSTHREGRNVRVLAVVLMGTIKQFSADNPALKLTVMDVQAALARVYDELTNRAAMVRGSPDPFKGIELIPLSPSCKAHYGFNG